MPDNTRNTRSGKADPHFDGGREGILNDPTGAHIGVEYGTILKKNRQPNADSAGEVNGDTLAKFEKLTRGQPAED